MRARDIPRSRPRHGRIVERRPDLFEGRRGRTGHADRGGDHFDSGRKLRADADDEDRKDRLRRRDARLPEVPERSARHHRRAEENADLTPGAVTVIEADIDDLSPQVFGYLMEKALSAGALDIFYMPAQMKKNRPGVLLTLLCNPPDRERMCDLIFRETTTLGVRYRNEQREILKREFVAVETEYGPIRIKVSRASDGRVMNASPEFEDCRAAAEKHRVGLREAQAAALKAYDVTGSSLKN